MPTSVESCGDIWDILHLGQAKFKRIGNESRPGTTTPRSGTTCPTPVSRRRHRWSASRRNRYRKCPRLLYGIVHGVRSAQVTALGLDVFTFRAFHRQCAGLSDDSAQRPGPVRPRLGPLEPQRRQPGLAPPPSTCWLGRSRPRSTRVVIAKVEPGAPGARAGEAFDPRRRPMGGWLARSAKSLYYISQS